MWLRLMWLVTGWALKGAYDEFTSGVKKLKVDKAKEYADAFQSGMDSQDALAVSNLADAFEQHGEPVYAQKLRTHVDELQRAAARVVVTPPPEPQAPSEQAPGEAA